MLNDTSEKRPLKSLEDANKLIQNLEEASEMPEILYNSIKSNLDQSSEKNRASGSKSVANLKGPSRE